MHTLNLKESNGTALPTMALSDSVQNSDIVRAMVVKWNDKKEVRTKFY